MQDTKAKLKKAHGEGTAEFICYQQFKTKEANHQTFKQKGAARTRHKSPKRSSSSRTKVQRRSALAHLPAVIWPTGTHWVMKQGW